MFRSKTLLKLLLNICMLMLLMSCLLIKIVCKLKYVATQKIFMFNEKLYKQANCVRMRNPVGHTLANFFLGHSEKMILQILKITTVCYRKFI